MHSTNTERARTPGGLQNPAEILGRLTVDSVAAGDFQAADEAWAALLRLRARRLSCQATLDSSTARVARLVRAVGR